MIPVKLTLQGLYSYQDEQVIDFTTLTQTGLFGIFGKVGSGKSSIIEAMTFALYGESERLNARDNRAYNMMNLRSNLSVVDFEFYNFEDQKYRVYRSFKRNAKRFDEVKRVEAILYKWEDQQWLPQPALDIVQVIGLSYENFKRTIIIPQGKFKEFIELGGKDRTKMMQEIFGLDRFDLSTKVKKIFATTKSEFDNLNGQLQGFTDITPSLIKEKEVLLLQGDKEVAQLNKDYKEQQEVFQHLKSIREDIIELENNINSFKELEIQEPAIIKQKKQLELYEQISKDFSLLLSQIQGNSSSLESKVILENQAKLQLVDLNNKAQQIQAKLDTASKEYLNIDTLKAQVQELEVVQHLGKAIAVQKALESRMENGKAQINQGKIDLDTLRKQYSNQLSVLEQRKKAIIDSHTLLQMENWFTTSTHLNQLKSQYENKIDVLQQQIKQVDISLDSFGVVSIVNWNQIFEQQKFKIEKDLNQSEEHLRHIRVAQQLEKYSKELVQGQPCPLCGALEHPSIVTGSNDAVVGQAKEKEGKIAQLKQQWALLNDKHSSVLTLFGKKDLLLGNLNNENIALEKIKQDLDKNLKSYLWQSICKADVDSFLSFKQKVSKINAEIIVLEKELRQFLEQGEKAKETLDRFVELLAQIQIQYAQVSSDVNSKKEQIKLVDLNDYLHLQQHEIALISNEKNKEVEQISFNYNQLSQDSKDIAVQMAGIQMQITTVDKDIEVLQQQGQIYQKELSKLLDKHNLLEISQVKEVLDWNLSTATLRESISAFELSIGLLRSSIKSLKEKLPEGDFDFEAFEQKQTLVGNLDLALKEKLAYCAILKAEKARLEKQYALKIELTQAYQALEVRLKNIHILDNMFKGAGFVNYVSSIYLKNLCNMANVRFHRLTNNQLSLQLNAANDFEIIDYLNDGKPRSVKTLSGGQIFQVSLSLALALAESVQSLSKSNKNFFFIDEGFGTQDSESVQTVFETLQNLQKEGRLVGIISHVDELQDLIPTSLTIQKSEQGVSSIVKPG